MKIQRFAIREQIYDLIIEKILKGEFPPGSVIRDTAIAREFGVSRTPARETLLRLEQKGFVENHLGRGFIITPLSSQIIRNVYPIIGNLEAFALLSISEKGKIKLDRLSELCTRMKNPSLTTQKKHEMDLKWHATLISSCENKVLLKIISDLKITVTRYELAYLDKTTHTEQSLKDHEKIIALIKKGEMKKAAEELNSHWLLSMRIQLENFKRKETEKT